VLNCAKFFSDRMSNPQSQQNKSLSSTLVDTIFSQRTHSHSAGNGVPPFNQYGTGFWHLVQ
jgi:hypothetical protein